MAILMKIDGTMKKVVPENGKAFLLKEMQKFVGGTVDIVPLPSGKEFIINDEGKLTGLLKNEQATKIWREEYPIEKYPENNDELIVGDVVLVEDLSEIE